MNKFNVDNCINCTECKVNNRGYEYDETGFYIECELDVWEGQRRVKISSQHVDIPDKCPKIINNEE